MISISIVAIILAALLIKLGALSVMVAVLAFTLKVIAALMVALAVLFIWTKHRHFRLPCRKE